MFNKKKACIIILVVNFILLGGAAVFIVWYTDNMIFPSFTIEQGAVNGYNFAVDDNRFNANFIFVVHSENNDPKYDIDYINMVVSVYHIGGYSLTYETEDSYVERHGSDTHFTAHPVAQNVEVTDEDTVAGLRNGTMDGHLDLEVRVRAKVKYEVKSWKHRNYLLKAICSPVVLNLTTWKTFNKTNCFVDSFRT